MKGLLRSIDFLNIQQNDLAKAVISIFIIIRELKLTASQKAAADKSKKFLDAIPLMWGDSVFLSDGVLFYVS